MSLYGRTRYHRTLENRSQKLPSKSNERKYRSLQVFEFSRAFIAPVLHGEKSGNFENPVKNAHKALVLFLILL